MRFSVQTDKPRLFGVNRSSSVRFTLRSQTKCKCVNNSMGGPFMHLFSYDKMLKPLISSEYSYFSQHLPFFLTSGHLWQAFALHFSFFSQNIPLFDLLPTQKGANRTQIKGAFFLRRIIVHFLFPKSFNFILNLLMDFLYVIIVKKIQI